MEKILTTILLCTVVACSSNPTKTYNTDTDSGVPVNPSGDASAKQDTGIPSDAGNPIPDAGKDSGSPINKDTGVDAFVPDSGVKDASNKDSEVEDGEADTDAETPSDSGTDAGNADSGTDTGTTECAPTSKDCADNVPRTCDSNGLWVKGTACPYVCSNGDCTGVCVPDTHRCDGLKSQTCNNLGQWVTDQTCPYVCSGAGNCTGECVPTSKDCVSKTPRTCNSSGYWVSGSACTYVCSAGDCTGVCNPGAKQCSSQQIQTCNDSGQWGTATNCPAVAGATSYCSGNSCTFDCNLDFDDCDSNSNNGCEVNLNTDKANCGTCGHSCCGGACSDGTCGVNDITILAQGYVPPAYLATDSYLYWSDGKTINRRPRDGGPDTTIVANQNSCVSNCITAFTIQGSDIFWLDRGKEIQGGGGIEPATGGVYSTPIAGGAITKYDNVGGYGGHIIVTATDIFYTQRQNKKVIAYILRSNPGVYDYVLTGTYAYSEPFVTDGTYVYATYESYSSNKIPIVKAPIHGGTVTTFETSNLSVAFSYSSITVNGAYLYYTFFTSDASKGIYKKPLSGEATTRLTATTSFSIATDGTNVYYSNDNARQVLKVSVNGGSPTVLASFSGTGSLSFEKKQVANGCLYWTGGTTGFQAIAVNP